MKRYVHEKISYIQTNSPDDEHILIIPGPKTEVVSGDRSRIYSIRSPLVSRSSRYRALLNLRAIGEILERERPDIIESSDPYQVGWKAVFAGRSLRIPVVGFYHSHFPEAYLRGPARLLRAPAQKYVRALYNRFEATLVPSEQLARVLENWGVGNVRTVNLGVNTEIFSPLPDDAAQTRSSLGIGPDRKLLLYVGRLAQEKNTETLFASFEMLAKRRPDEFALLIIGDGPQREQLRRLQAKTGGVKWIQYCTDSQELARFYRAADLFVHPGVQETFGLVALESQACGTPVVGIRGSYMDRIIFHEQESWARENTPEALADAIEAFCEQRFEKPGRDGGGGGGRGLFLATSLRETSLHLPRGLRKLPAAIRPMKDEKAFVIRSYRASDREAVRRLCCQTGFLGEPIDPVYEDRELFADFLTTYYTDHEPESSFVIEMEGELRGYLLGCRKPLRNQLYSFQQNLVLFSRALLRYPRYNERSRRFIRWILRHGWREVPAAPRRTPAFSHQPAAGSAQDVDHAGVIQCLFRVSVSQRRAARLRSDRHLREPARRKDVRALWISRF